MATEETEPIEEEEKLHTSIIVVDGIPLSLEAPDIDKDGVVGGVETVVQGEKGIMPITQPTELGETLRELNKDILETTRMTSIDMRSRLHHVEISFVLQLDSLVALGICPTECLSVTRQKKRLSVSLDGKGRDDIVQVVAGKREMDAKKGFMGGMQGFMGMGQQPK